jgi:hypothetical protein
MGSLIILRPFDFEALGADITKYLVGFLGDLGAVSHVNKFLQTCCLCKWEKFLSDEMYVEFSGCCHWYVYPKSVYLTKQTEFVNTDTCEVDHNQSHHHTGQFLDQIGFVITRKCILNRSGRQLTRSRYQIRNTESEFRVFVKLDPVEMKSESVNVRHCLTFEDVSITISPEVEVKEQFFSSRNSWWWSKRSKANDCDFLCFGDFVRDYLQDDNVNLRFVDTKVLRQDAGCDFVQIGADVYATIYATSLEMLNLRHFDPILTLPIISAREIFNRPEIFIGSYPKFLARL